jgi:hypothetical protein
VSTQHRISGGRSGERISGRCLPAVGRLGDESRRGGDVSPVPCGVRKFDSRRLGPCNYRYSSSRRATALDQATPFSTEKGSTLDAQLAGRSKPFGHQRFSANAWSTYGAQRAQPVPTGGKWDSAGNGSNRPIRNQVATHGNGPRPHGKEGVDGSSPSEGSAKAPHVGAFYQRYFESGVPIDRDDLPSLRR